MSESNPHLYFAANNFTPVITSAIDWNVLRRTVWKVQNRDASYGYFTSWWFFGHLQWYHGTAKCDGSESHKAGRIVMTDQPSELLAFRWRQKRPSSPYWDNMGGT